MYGQSRSAAVVVSYLLSKGMFIDDAVQLLKERRPATCINPGFLAQLFLLSRRNSHLAQIQLVMRGVLKCRGLKTFGTDTINNIGKSSGELTPEYFDSYRPVNIANRECQRRDVLQVDGRGRDDIHCDTRIDSNSSKKILHPLGHEQGQGQDQIISTIKHDDTSGIPTDVLEEMINVPQIKTESVECGKCSYVLACDSDIVRAIDYSEFLCKATDDYWKGYTAIHPSAGHVMSLDNCKKMKRKRMNIRRKPVVATKNRSGECNSKMMQKRNCDQLDSEEAVYDIQDLVILGPMDWILSQMDEDNSLNLNEHLAVTVEDGDAASGTVPGSSHASGYRMRQQASSSIRCPNCRIECGYYKHNGLDLCNSFLRCELFALHRSKIKIVESTETAKDVKYSCGVSK